MARDIFHPIVREALEKDGWRITHDPYTIRTTVRSYSVDLAAEQVLAAEKGISKIAVEVKSFISPSTAYEFHAALGQYLNYATFMEMQEPERVLYLAVSKGVYLDFFVEEDTQLILNKFGINTLVVNSKSRTVESWTQRSKHTQ